MSDGPYTQNVAQSEEPQNDEIARLSDAGSQMLDEGDAEGAIATWREALAQLPEPAAESAEAVWLHAAIGDAFDRIGDAEASEQAFRRALETDTGAADPAVRYMLGLLIAERGDTAEATPHLAQAYALTGRRLFEGERGDAAWEALHAG